MLFAHLNLAQRYQIQTRLAAAQPVAVIARALGVHRSTVYRELERGAVQEDYQAERAQARAKQRRVSSAANHPVKPPSLWQQVRRLLRRYWSPEQIAGRGPLEGGQAVSTQATYAWLKRTGSALTTRLRHYRALMPWRTSTGDLPKTRPSIRQRPSEVHQRHTLGHWEGDLDGAFPARVPGDAGGIATFTVERKSLYTRLSSVLPKTAAHVAHAISRKGDKSRALNGLNAHTLTLDNGSEFAHYATITQTLGTRVYFADPARPGQRARNENTNGLIRQYLPKGALLDRFATRYIRLIQDRLNHRPRKSLGFKTPHEVFFNLPITPVAVRT